MSRDFNHLRTKPDTDPPEPIVTVSLHTRKNYTLPTETVEELKQLQKFLKTKNETETLEAVIAIATELFKEYDIDYKRKLIFNLKHKEQA